MSRMLGVCDSNCNKSRSKNCYFRLSTFIVQQVIKHNRKAKPLESLYRYLLAEKGKHEGQKMQRRSEIGQ